MQGRRVQPNADGVYPFDQFRPGDFFKWDGRWFGITPNDHHCNLAKHTVTEHEDGTITVSPSIIVWAKDHKEVWHGFLEKGVWREC